jgi:uncharacterized repeat protein (TIGR01451 family)
MPWTELRTASAGLATLLAGLVMAAPATARTEPLAPQLSISVDNGETSATVGDTLTYAIVVENLGATRIRHLQVTQTLPDGLDFTSADTSGVATKQAVEWTVDLAPTSQTVLHTTMEVVETPKDLLRLATVACAGLSADKAPVVCATHSDELPAGAAAAAVAAAPRHPGSDHEESARLSTAEYAGFAGLLVLLAALGAVAVRRRGGSTHAS